MPILRLAPFGGMRPAISSPLREARYGDYVCNAKLLTGSLKPLRKPRLIKEGDFKSIIHYPLTENGKLCGIEAREECAFSFPDNTTGCSGFTTSVIFYHKCESKKPERIDHETCEVCPLCLEGPVGEELTAEVLDTGIIEQLDTRIYTYTWVDKYGIESPPAMPSNDLCLGDDGEVRLTNFDTPPAGAVCIRIYRTSSPFLDGDDPSSTFDTTFQLVEEVAIDDFQGFYVDDKCLLEMCLGTLQTMDYCCPPEMCGVVKTESGYYVGWSGNTLYVSGRHQPYNFPLDNVIELETQIVGIVANRDRVLVGTTGKPYRLSIAAREQGDVIEAEAYRDHLPMVNPDTLVETPWGAVYASNIGLVGLFPERQPVVISRERITEDQWKQYIPCSAAWHRGRYYGFRENGKGFVFDVAEAGESRLEIGDFSLIDFNARQSLSTPDGNLYLLNDEGVWDWENGIEPFEFIWKSKTFIGKNRSSLGAANYVGSGDVTLKLYADGCKVYDCPISGCGPIRLGKLPKGRKWCVELCGTGCVDDLILGSSIGDVSNVG